MGSAQENGTRQRNTHSQTSTNLGLFFKRIFYINSVGSQTRVSAPSLFQIIQEYIFLGKWESFLEVGVGGVGTGSSFSCFVLLREWVGNLYPVLFPLLFFGIFVADLYSNKNSSKLALICGCVALHHVTFFCAFTIHFLQLRNP